MNLTNIPWYEPPEITDYAGHSMLYGSRLGIQRAHIVGHSSSAVIALQLAFDAPGSVLSVALLETALLAVPSGRWSSRRASRTC